MKNLKVIAFILLVIGGLNWGLVGLGMGDVIGQLLAFFPSLLRVVYILVGLSALWLIFDRPRLK